jgi:hypothetical protein
MSCQLYRYYDADGFLLYVGISHSAVHRAARHKKEAHWYPMATTMIIENCKDRDDATRKEAAAISREKPLHNIAGNYSRSGAAVPRTINLAAALMEINNQHNEKRAAAFAALEKQMNANEKRLRAEVEAKTVEIEVLKKTIAELDGQAVTERHVLWQHYQIWNARADAEMRRNLPRAATGTERGKNVNGGILDGIESCARRWHPVEAWKRWLRRVGGEVTQRIANPPINPAKSTACAGTNPQT